MFNPFSAGLPWKWIGIGVGSLLLIVAIFFGVSRVLHNAREEGLKAGRAEVQAKWGADKEGRATARAELSEALAEAFNGLDGSLQATLTKINKSGDTIVIRANKEMAGDPRYTSADCSLTPGVHEQINAARGLSRPAAPAPVRDGGVPTGGAAVRLEFGEPGSK